MTTVSVTTSVTVSLTVVTPVPDQTHSTPPEVRVYSQKYTGSRFLGVNPNVWGPLAHPLVGVGGRVICQVVDFIEIGLVG